MPDKNQAEALAESVEAAVLSAVETFGTGVEKTQKAIFKEVSGLIREMTLDADGNFKRTNANLKTLDNTRDKLRGVIVTESYRKRVRGFTNQIPGLAGMNDDYFSLILAGSFAPSDALKKALIDGAIADTEASLIGAGLDASVIDPIRVMLRQNVTSGGSAFDLSEQLRTFIMGDSERLGALSRYSGQITRDSLNQFSRNYHQAVADDSGLVWYWYSRGTVSDSREFCIHRNGRYWHKDEIKAWAGIPQWQGKIPATTSASIFTYLGGYNCMHGVNAVSDFVVPKSDKARARSRGFIK